VRAAADRRGPQRGPDQRGQAPGAGLGVHGHRRGAEHHGDLRRDRRAGVPAAGGASGRKGGGLTMPALPQNIYLLDLPLLIGLVSLVYSATRFDRWSAIFREAVRWAGRLLAFLAAIGLALYLVNRF